MTRFESSGAAIYLSWDGQMHPSSFIDSAGRPGSKGNSYSHCMFFMTLFMTFFLTQGRAPVCFLPFQSLSPASCPAMSDRQLDLTPQQAEIHIICRWAKGAMLTKRSTQHSRRAKKGNHYSHFSWGKPYRST